MDSAENILDGSAGEEEELEHMTSGEVLEKLEEAWLNEKSCPELLDHQTEIVDCMLEQIQQMETNVKRLNTGDIRISIHNMEIHRIRYILSSYLRQRLDKIQNCCAHILEEAKQAGTNSNRLSEAELHFAKEYLGSVENHFKLLALRHMPTNFQPLDSNNTMPKPNLGSYVVLKVNETIPGVLIEEESADAGEDVVDLEIGSQHIMKYQPVAHLIASGSVSLI